MGRLFTCTGETTTLSDTQAPILNGRTEGALRLLADTREPYGSPVKDQAHHILALEDPQKQGRAETSA